MLSFVTALTLAFPFMGPNVPLSDALEVCILKAEICALENSAKYCGDGVKETNPECVSDYEDCSYNLPGTQAPSCRLDYVWCKLEITALSDPEYRKFCNSVYETCPSQV
jgi:hypothetical protein